MRILTTIALLLGFSATAGAAPGSGHRDRTVRAQTHHRMPTPARLAVSNHFDAEVEVRLDGYAVDRVAPNRTSVISARPGYHEVSFCRPTTGVCFQRDTVRLSGARTTTMTVVTPLSKMLVTNDGRGALRVTAAAGEPVWISPGESARLVVPAGNVYTSATLVGRHSGGQSVFSERVWVEPGRTRSLRLRYDPPERTQPLTLRNSEPHDVLVYADGRYLGMIRAHGAASFDLPRGPVHIRVTDRRGFSVLTTTMHVGTRSPSVVVVRDRRTPERSYVSARYR